VGSGLLALGLLRLPRIEWSLSVTGAALLYRGLRGYCAVFHALGIDRATDEQGRRGDLGVKVEREVSMEDGMFPSIGMVWGETRRKRAGTEMEEMKSKKAVDPQDVRMLQ
jgi:hypothetical protein